MQTVDFNIKNRFWYVLKTPLYNLWFVYILYIQFPIHVYMIISQQVLTKSIYNPNWYEQMNFWYEQMNLIPVWNHDVITQATLAI